MKHGKSDTSESLLLLARIKLHLKFSVGFFVFGKGKESRSNCSVLQLEPHLQSGQLNNWKKIILQPNKTIVCYAILHLE